MYQVSFHNGSCSGGDAVVRSSRRKLRADRSAPALLALAVALWHGLVIPPWTTYTYRGPAAVEQAKPRAAAGARRPRPRARSQACF
jgi:hypothetical protein